jgi:hypothetical protein
MPAIHLMIAGMARSYKPRTSAFLLIMRRLFVCSPAHIPGFFQGFHVSYQRFANRFKARQFLLLLIDRLVQFFDQVFLESDFCFDVFYTFFVHEVILKVRRLAE